MKINLSSAFFILIPFLLQGQKIQSLDFVTGIDVSYRLLASKHNSSLNSLIIKIRNQRELPALQWRMGINYNQKLNENYFLKTGIRLAKLGYYIEIPKEDFRWPSQINNPNSPGEDIGDIKMHYNYLFIEVPVTIRYEGKKKRFAPYFEAGFSPMWLVQYSSVTVKDSVTNISFGQPVNADFNNFQIAAVLSFGFNYQMNNAIQLFGQPNLRFNLTKLVDAPISEYLYNFGFEFGIRRLW